MDKRELKKLIDELMEAGREAHAEETDLYKSLEKMSEAMYPDYKSWPQVAVMTPEERLTQRNLQRQGEIAFEEVNSLKAKANAVQSAFDAERQSMWSGIYKTHGLPVAGVYHITDDGRILVKPGSVKGASCAFKEEEGKN